MVNAASAQIDSRWGGLHDEILGHASYVTPTQAQNEQVRQQPTVSLLHISTASGACSVRGSLALSRTTACQIRCFPTSLH